MFASADSYFSFSENWVMETPAAEELVPMELLTMLQGPVSNPARL